MKTRACHSSFLFSLGAASLLVASSESLGSDRYRVTSPDKRIEVRIQVAPRESKERPSWSATFHGKSVATNCVLGLQTADAGDLLESTRAIKTKNRFVDDRIPVLFGKAGSAHDQFQELRLTLENPKGRRTDVIFRCYNDAIALRYELRGDPQDSEVTITEEGTSFHIQGNPTAYAQYLENYTTSHEHKVVTVPYHDLRADTLLDMPLTFSWADGTCAALTEAALRRYAGMSLMRPAGHDDLVCRLTPRPNGTKVMSPLPLETPWRVLLIADRPGALLESETIYCLNSPSAIKDTSWIKPGKITFSWWNGDVYDGKRSLPILSFEMAKKYLDFCARNGIPTHSLTSTEGSVTPWYRQSKPGVEPGPDTDVTRPREGFDLAAIRAYAQSKNVRLWTWVHQGALRGRVEEAFSAFEKLGWSGMMVDFFDHDDQESVEFAESILEAAARHHIMIHFHGIWKPTGLERTYPNLMNHEGALNLEYLKWSDLCTPEHNLMMASTRLIAGPMDYHLGGFRSVLRSEFKPQNVAPNVLGTRGHHLALYVCFDNPNPMIADYPTAYEGQPGFDFLKMVPTWWDETRVLVDEIGEVLVTARRKGKTWYLGCISAKKSREIEVPLSFLAKGNYTAAIWRDATDAEKEPNHLTTETLNFSPKQTFKLHVATDGGFVARFSPARP